MIQGWSKAELDYGVASRRADGQLLTERARSLALAPARLYADLLQRGPPASARMLLVLESREGGAAFSMSARTRLAWWTAAAAVVREAELRTLDGLVEKSQLRGAHPLAQHERISSSSLLARRA